MTKDIATKSTGMLYAEVRRCHVADRAELVGEVQRGRTRGPDRLRPRSLTPFEASTFMGASAFRNHCA
jgi:hypothetical protein